MQVNYVNIYNNYTEWITTQQGSLPLRIQKPTDFHLLLRNNVASIRKWDIT